MAAKPVEHDPFAESAPSGGVAVEHDPFADKPKEEPKKKGFGQRATEFAESVGGGTLIGYATPEIVQGVGKGISTFAPSTLKPAGYVIDAAGKMMRGQRGKEALIGALGGGGGNIAGQLVEAKGGTPIAVTAAELAGGVIAPAMANTIKTAVKYLFSKGASTVGAIAKDIGLDEKTLPPNIRDYIKKQIDELRGTSPTGKSQEALHEALKTGATSIEREAEGRAAIRRFEGDIQQRELEAQAEKMRVAGKKTLDIGGQTTAEAKAARSNIGTEREASDVGVTMRDKIVNLFGDIASKRSAEYKAQKAIRDAAVAEKESAGDFVQNMPEYQSLLSGLRDKLLIGAKAQEQKTAQVTEPGVRKAYENIYEAVSARRVQVGVNAEGNPVYKTFPTSFDALDDVRRRLGDVAFGKDVEGYSAIGADIAKDYYGKISDIQSKFAGESHDALQSGYEMASRLLDKYKSRAGKKATAIDRFDPTRFNTDPASLPNAYFSSKQSVADLIELSGGDRPFVTKAASDFTARQLRDKNFSGAKTWANQNSDWLNALPEVKSKVDSYLATLERAERVAKKTGSAATILEARVPTVEARGARAVSQAETEAGQITSAAQDRVKTILGDANPEKRIQEIILGGKPSVWKEVGPILAASPNGKALVADAVNQIMADRASGGLRSAVIAFRQDVGPSLKAANLMSDAEVSALQAKLQNIANSSLGEAAKLTTIQKMIKNALIGVAAQPVGAAVDNTVRAGKSFYDTLTKPSPVGSMSPRF